MIIWYYFNVYKWIHYTQNALLKEVWFIKTFIVGLLLEFQTGRPETHWWRLLNQKHVCLWIEIYAKLLVLTCSPLQNVMIETT